jgi:hypothetical protein
MCTNKSIFLSLFLIQSVFAQRGKDSCCDSNELKFSPIYPTEGNMCSPLNSYTGGICLPLERCPQAQHNLRIGLRSQICSYNDGQPIYCCSTGSSYQRPPQKQHPRIMKIQKSKRISEISNLDWHYVLL